MHKFAENIPEDVARWAIIDSKAKEYRLCELFDLLNRNSIKAILVKGWAVGRFYPSDQARAYTDIDIAVDSSEFEFTRRVIRESRLKAPIDIHCELRTLDRRKWSEVFSASYETELNGTRIRTLSDEDNLSVTAVHWLTDGGINRERLWDIYHLVQNRPFDFNWERCLGSNGDVRRTWIVSTIAAACRYLNLERSSLPDEIERAELPTWFCNTLEREWKLGVYRRVPVRLCIGDPKLLAEQLRRRFPPNKIAAMVEMEQPINTGGRGLVQIRSLVKRLVSALKRTIN